MRSYELRAHADCCRHSAVGAAVAPAAAGGGFPRCGAGLSVAAGAARGRHGRRQRAGHPLARDRAMAVGAARPAVRHRQPGRGRHQHRHRGGRARAADGYTLLSIGPSSAVNATLYPKLGFNFIRDIAPVASMVHQSQVVVVQSVDAGEHDGGVRRLHQSQPGQDQLRVVGRRHRQPARGRAVQDGRGRRHGARALSRRRAGDDRSDRRAGAGDVRLAGGGDGAHQERQAAGARGDHGQARRTAAGPADGGRHGARLQVRAPGSASAPRTARRPRSSSCSTRRSMPGSPTPRCGRAMPTSAAGSSPARRPSSAS